MVNNSCKKKNEINTSPTIKTKTLLGSLGGFLPPLYRIRSLDIFISGSPVPRFLQASQSRQVAGLFIGAIHGTTLWCQCQVDDLTAAGWKKRIHSWEKMDLLWFLWKHIQFHTWGVEWRMSPLVNSSTICYGKISIVNRSIVIKHLWTIFHRLCHITGG